jgi:hypothetical protein
MVYAEGLPCCRLVTILFLKPFPIFLNDNPSGNHCRSAAQQEQLACG